jgi:predicted nucleic acid-binding protein
MKSNFAYVQKLVWVNVLKIASLGIHPVNQQRPVMLLSEFNILHYNTKSYKIYQSFKLKRIYFGTPDLKIASIVLAYNSILLTRNLQDFEKVPALNIQ